MKTITLLLLVCGLATASIPTIFGPAGLPGDWSITTMTVDTIFGENDEYFFNSPNNYWTFSGNTSLDFYAAYVSYALATVAVGTPSGSWRCGLGGTGEILFYSSSARSDISFDPNDSGSGDINFGVAGDSDSLFSNCVYNEFAGQMNADTLTFNSMAGFVREITTDYTATLSDWQIVVTAAADITLPALSAAYDSLSPLTGNGFQLDIQLSVDEACTLFAAGSDSLNNGVSVVLSQWDNYSVRATHDRWIIR